MHLDPTILSTLVVLAEAIPRLVDQKKGLAIPISKRLHLVDSDRNVDLDMVGSHIASVRTKVLYGFRNYKINTGVEHPFSAKGLRKRGGNCIPLDRYGSDVWYGTISIGDDGQDFDVVFDTGSSDLFVPTVDCEDCKGHNLWDPAFSTTSYNTTQPFSFQYGDGSTVSGHIFTDIVSLSGFAATSQTLGAAMTLSPQFRHPEFMPDGVMGMAFPEVSHYHTTPVFLTLIEQGKIIDQEFSFKLSSRDGELYVGGSNTDLYTGDFVFVDVTVEGFWQVNMDSIVGGDEVIISGVPAFFDTGSVLINGPMSQVDALHGTLGGEPILSRPGYYTYPCDEFPSISLGFGGALFRIPPETLNLGKVGKRPDICMCGIVGDDDIGDLWCIGDVFLQSVYTMFDVRNRRVGFARLR